MITDRNPLIPITADKALVREYLRKKLGPVHAEEILIPVYHISKTGRDIPHAEWDVEFFLKANHGSGMNQLIPAGEDPEKVAALAQKWLNTSYGQARHEWAYRDIPRQILCEKVLREEDGRIPMDIKFYCFHGKCKLVLYYKDRMEQPAWIFSDENGNQIINIQTTGKQLLEEVPEIPSLPKMVQLAETIAEEFSYCRVDLYALQDKIYFGEITHYTGAGMEKLDTYEIDLALVRLWLPENKHKSFMELYQEVMGEKGSKVPGSISPTLAY